MSSDRLDLSSEALYAAYVGAANHAAIQKISEPARKELVHRILDLARADRSYHAMARGQREEDAREWLDGRNFRSVSLLVCLPPSSTNRPPSSRIGPTSPSQR